MVVKSAMCGLTERHEVSKTNSVIVIVKQAYLNLHSRDLRTVFDQGLLVHKSSASDPPEYEIQH